MLSKKDYLENASNHYDKLIKAQKMAIKLEKKIIKIREKGYKLIILGNKVKITI
jgi:hypothetical protein